MGFLEGIEVMVSDHLGPGDLFQNVGVIVVLGYDEHFTVL